MINGHKLSSCFHSYISLNAQHERMWANAAASRWSKRDESVSRHEAKRHGNILIGVGRRSVVMLAAFLRLRANISLLGDAQVKRMEAARSRGWAWGQHDLRTSTLIFNLPLASVCVHAWKPPRTKAGMLHMCVHAQLHRHAHMYTNPYKAIIHNLVFWRHDVTRLSFTCTRSLRSAQNISQADKRVAAHYCV